MHGCDGSNGHSSCSSCGCHNHCEVACDDGGAGVGALSTSDGSSSSSKMSEFSSSD